MNIQIRNLRWWIAILLAAAIGLNYLDRQSFPVAVVEMQKTIPISNRQYGDLQALFLFAYAIMYAGGGKLLDVLGTRLGYALMITWWSAANLMHGLVHTFDTLAIARFLLGIGEGGGFPGSAKAVSEWFPPGERSLAFGIFTAGSSVGPMVAAPMVAVIIILLNWRWVFFITGIMGFAWVVIWWIVYELPERHRNITAAERDYILDSLKETRSRASREAPASIPWISLFRYRQMWGLLLPKFLTDSAWFFLIFWLPKYLADIRHLDIRQIGEYAWIPFAVSGLGAMAGGWLSGFLIRRRVSLDHSRKVTLAIGAAIVPVSLLIAKSPIELAILLYGFALFGHQFWSTILQTLAADLFPSTTVGSVSGLMGAVGAVGAMLFNLLAGMLLVHPYGYPLLFTIVGLLYPSSFAVILTLVRRIGPLKQPVACYPLP